MKGFINLNKPIGMSSAKAVAIVKQKLNLKNEKVGHTGTLDPLASGVLPIAIGRATRLFGFMLTKHKTYIAEFTFGYQTNTLDSEGEVEFRSDYIPSKQEIEKVTCKFIGKISQIPPQFSAKSVNGIRAYEKARKGEEIDLKPSIVEIIEFRVLGQSENSFKFLITCGSGTYIRSLCRDLARELNTFATMTSLERVQSGVFDIETAVDLDNLSEDKILDCDIVLQTLERIDLDSVQEKTLLDGKKLILDKISGQYKAYCGELIGILSIDKNGLVKMDTWLK